MALPRNECQWEQETLRQFIKFASSMSRFDAPLSCLDSAAKAMCQCPFEARESDSGTYSCWRGLVLEVEL